MKHAVLSVAVVKRPEGIRYRQRIYTKLMNVMSRLHANASGVVVKKKKQ